MTESKKQQNLDGSKSDKKRETGLDRIIVEIEFCTNCDAHLFAVRHQQAKYSSHYEAIKKKLQQHKIVVRKKTVPQNLYKKSPYCPSNVFYKVQNNELIYFPEIGSFEVYLNGNKIFSKLQSLKWPTAEIIEFQVQRILLLNDEVKIQHPKAQEKTQKQQNVHELQNKKGQYKVKNKQQDLLNFRYSIDKRNLFKKPQNNYLYRKSVTSRYQNNTEATSRKINTTRYQKQIKQEQPPFTQGRNRKDLSDQFVIQMYQKKQPQIEEKLAITQVTKKSKRKSIHNNIYLQPIFPKTSVNLQNYARQKMIFASKIHQQRRSYEASKHLPKTKPQPQLTKGNIVLHAKFNQDCNTLFKDKQLKNIKETTEENQTKQKEYKNQIAKVEQLQKEMDIVVENQNINGLFLPKEAQKDLNQLDLNRCVNSPIENSKIDLKQLREEQTQKSQHIEEAQKHPINKVEQSEDVFKAPQNKLPTHSFQKRTEQVDIDKIVTTKTINQHQASKIKQPQNAYDEQFEQEENRHSNSQKNKVILQQERKQITQNQKQKNQQEQYEDQFEKQRQNEHQDKNYAPTQENKQVINEAPNQIQN